MRIIRLIVTSILVAYSILLSADNSANVFQVKSSNDTTISPLDLDIQRLIVKGVEREIKKYFSTASLAEIIKSDSGAIVKAFKRINTNDKVTRTIWILEEVKNRKGDVREYIYNELLKVDYGKPSFILNHMINNYFVNYKEIDSALTDKVRKLQRKMNRK